MVPVLTACMAGRGVAGLAHLPSTTGVTLASTKTMGALIALAPAAMSFEVWATFNATDDSAAGAIRPLLMLGQGNTQPGSPFSKR